MPDFIPQTLLLVLLFAFGAGVLAKKLKQPLLLGYLIAGLLISLIAKKIGLDKDSLKSLSELGLTLLMFTVGLEFSFTKAEKIKRVVVSGALIQILATLIFGAFICLYFFNLDFRSSVIISLAFSLSSTAIVVKILTEKGRLDSLPGEIMTGWLLIQDLAVLPMIALLPILFNGGEMAANLIFLGKALLVILVALIFAKKIVPILTDKISGLKSRELLLLFTVCLIFVFSVFTKALGFSYGLGAFFAGLVLSQATAHFAIFSEIRPLRDVFLAIFFVSLGLALDPNLLAVSWPKAVLLGASFIGLKIIIVGLILFIFGYHGRVIAAASFGLAEVGEFAFVLASAANIAGFLGNNEYSLIILVSLGTMVMTPWLIAFGEKIYFWLSCRADTFPPFLAGFLKGADYESGPEELEYHDHAVILGYGRVGKYVGSALEKAKIPHLIVEYNQEIVRQLRLQGKKVVFGDPTNRDVLDFAQVDKAKLVIIAIPDSFSQKVIAENCRELNPEVKIICRSHFEEDFDLLRGLGVEYIIQPEFEAGLSIVHRSLHCFGFTKEEVGQKIRDIRQEHEK